jgi:hypothetical protein
VWLQQPTREWEGAAGMVHALPGKGVPRPPHSGDGKPAQVSLDHSHQWKTSFWAKCGPSLGLRTGRGGKQLPSPAVGWHLGPLCSTLATDSSLHCTAVGLSTGCQGQPGCAEPVSLTTGGFAWLVLPTDAQGSTLSPPGQCPGEGLPAEQRPSPCLSALEKGL